MQPPNGAWSLAVPGVRPAVGRHGHRPVPPVRPARRGPGRAGGRPDRDHPHRPRPRPGRPAGHPRGPRHPAPPSRRAAGAAAPVPPPPPRPAPAPPAAARCSPHPPPPPPPRRRLSPQQVLLSLGALLLVSAAITFVAVAWTQLGVVFQSLVMLVVTSLLCGASAWIARRGLRATEEALAAAGAALIAVDLAAARWLGLFRLEDVSAAALVGGVLRRPRGGRRTARPVDPDDGDLAAGRPARRPAPAVPAASRRAGHRPGGGRDRPGRRGGRRRRPRSGSAPAGAPGLGARRCVRGRRCRGRAGGRRRGRRAGVVVGDGDPRGGRRRRRPPLGTAGPLHASPRSCPPASDGSVGPALALSLRTVGDPGLLVAAGIGLALLVAAVLTVGRTAVTALLAAGGVAATLVPAGFLADRAAARRVRARGARR